MIITSMMSRKGKKIIEEVRGRQKFYYFILLLSLVATILLGGIFNSNNVDAKRIDDQYHNYKFSIRNQGSVRGVQLAEQNNNQNQGGGNSSPNECGTAHTFFDWGCNGASDKDSILTVLVTISNWLAAGVVIAVIGGIIYGAIMYATSAGDASKAKSATEIIRNAFIALILYFLMWAFLQYIVPGGLFN